MKTTPVLNFTFVNPNSLSTFEAAMKNILLDKLLAEFEYSDVLPAAE